MKVTGFVEKGDIRRWFTADVICAVHLRPSVMMNVSLNERRQFEVVRLHCAGHKKIPAAYVEPDQLLNVNCFSNEKNFQRFLAYRASLGEEGR